MEAEEEDLFIPEEYSGGAFHRDQVEVMLLEKQEGRRKEGKVIRVLSHEITELVGTFERSNNFGFVRADHPKISRDIFIPKEKMMDAKTGQKVVVQICDYGDFRKSPEGKVTEILGDAAEAGVDILSIARGYDIPMVFPEKVLRQADRCPDGVIPNDFNGRQDLRDWQMVTIDGEDAKDLDDAVSVVKEGEYFLLGVHIAMWV